MRDCLASAKMGDRSGLPRVALGPLLRGERVRRAGRLSRNPLNSFIGFLEKKFSTEIKGGVENDLVCLSEAYPLEILLSRNYYFSCGVFPPIQLVY